MNVQSHHKWWSTLKFAASGRSSSLPPLVSESGGLVCESVGKADLLSDHFDSKQSREAVDLLFTCHPSPSLTTFAFRSRCIFFVLYAVSLCNVLLTIGQYSIDISIKYSFKC